MDTDWEGTGKIIDGKIIRDDEGLSGSGSRKALVELVELNEQLSFVRSEALQPLGTQPE